MAWGNGAPRGWPILSGASAVCYVNSGESEGVTGTTSGTFVTKLTVSFTAVLGVRYHINRKSTRLNSSHSQQSRMPSSA